MPAFLTARTNMTSALAGLVDWIVGEFVGWIVGGGVGWLVAGSLHPITNKPTNQQTSKQNLLILSPPHLVTFCRHVPRHHPFFGLKISFTHTF
jgi:hypothetical protein